MRTRALVVTIAFAVSLGCGGKDPSPAPPPDTGGGSGDSGGGGSGGGGSGGGGSGDGGGTAGGGSGGGDTGGGSGGSGGTPSGGGGTGGDGGGTGGGTAGGGAGGTAGPIASADGSVVIERIDADAECDALLPARAPDAVTLRVVSDTPSCGGGLSDGGGNVAVAGRVGQGFMRWQVFTSSGAPEGTFSTQWNGVSPRPLIQQPDGFQGLLVTDPGRSSVQVDVVTFSGNGSLRRTERPTPPFPDRITFGWIHAEDPLGGSVLVHFGFDRPANRCSGIVSRFDAAGAPAGTGRYGTGGDCRAIGAAVSGRGEALVVEAFDGTAWLWWVAKDGHLVQPAAPAGATAALFSRNQGVVLAPLLDGSIAASEGGTWTRRFPYLGEHAEDAPGWLASRPGFTFRNTRGARGYALLPPASAQSDDCSQRIELVAPSGRLCAKVTLKGDGGSCSTASVDQGWDGTVVQQSPRDRCAWRAWPRLLAGG